MFNQTLLQQYIIRGMHLLTFLEFKSMDGKKHPTSKVIQKSSNKDVLTLTWVWDQLLRWEKMFFLRWKIISKWIKRSWFGMNVNENTLSHGAKGKHSHDSQGVPNLWSKILGTKLSSNSTFINCWKGYEK
jgi:hypothetical protein